MLCANIAGCHVRKSKFSLTDWHGGEFALKLNSHFMSCLSRLLGLFLAIVPGLLFLVFSVLFFQRWPQLGMVTGPLYSLANFVTGAVCLYLGVKILFARDKTDEIATPDVGPAPVIARDMPEAKPMQAAPLPVLPEPMPLAATAPEPPVALAKEAVVTPLDSPEIRIRHIAMSRPNWRVTAPQLAHLTNLNMAVADATARQMVSDGNAQMQTGPNGETVYVFDLTA